MIDEDCVMENIYTRFENMPTTIGAFVVENGDMSYTIVLNSRMTRERNLISYKHELKHIGNKDFEKYDVGEIETRAHEED